MVWYSSRVRVRVKLRLDVYIEDLGIELASISN
jgi:hypothetical protein